MGSSNKDCRLELHLLDLDPLLEVEEVETEEDWEIEETILLNFFGFFNCATNTCKSINNVFRVLFVSIFGTLNK